MITERELDIWKLEADFEYGELIKDVVQRFYGNRTVENGISQGNFSQQEGVYQENGEQADPAYVSQETGEAGY